MGLLFPSRLFDDGSQRPLFWGPPTALKGFKFQLSEDRDGLIDVIYQQVPVSMDARSEYGSQLGIYVRFR